MAEKSIREIVEQIVTCTCPPNRKDTGHWNQCPTWAHDELIDAMESYAASKVTELEGRVKEAVLAYDLCSAIMHAVLEWYHSDDDLMPQELVDQLTAESRRISRLITAKEPTNG